MVYFVTLKIKVKNIMSRISRYQDSINKFIQTKSSLRSISLHNKKHLEDTYEDYDHLVAIFLVSILNNKCKKSKLKFHGYYIASGIDIGLSIAKITDRFDYHRGKIGNKEMANFLPELVSIMYQSLSGNIDSLKLNVSIEETMRISQYCINYMSSKIGPLTIVEDTIPNEPMVKTDFAQYKFKSEQHRNKYKHMKRVPNKKLFDMIDNKYGSVCKMSLIFGWLLGLGDEKSVPKLEKMGMHMGRLFKIAYDFENIDEDMEHCDFFSYNTVINIGIKESVWMYLESKAELLEGISELKIWSTTIKEILDLIETKLDKGLNKSDIDEEYEYSEFSEYSKSHSLEKVKNSEKKYVKVVKS